MTDEINYAEYLPTQPPEGTIEWLHKTGKLTDEYIVYRSVYHTDPLTGIKNKAVQCTCTNCQNTFIMPRIEIEHCNCLCSYPSTSFGFENIVDDEYINVISGQETQCPYCDAMVQALHVSGISRYGDTAENVYIMTVHKIRNRLALLTWYIKKILYKSGETQIEISPYEAYVVSDRKIIRLTGYEKCLTTVSYFGKWKQRKQFRDTWGKTSVSTHIFPWDPDILIGTTAENCKLDLYMSCDTEVYPVTYMNLWLKHKNVENLIMQGAGRIINAKIAGITSYYSNYVPSIRNIRGIDWKAAKPHEMLGLSKEDFRYVKKHEWNLDDLEFYKKAAVHGIRPEDLEICRWYIFHEVEKLFDYPVNIMKVLRYLDKQNKKYPDQRETDVGTLLDYWDISERLGDDLSSESARYPQNLIRAHDTAVQRMEWKANAELVQMFDERYEQLKKYCYSSGGLEIHPARSQQEMIIEGKVLHHCVGGYVKRHAKGETAIFFIRHTDTPESPYFTLELNEKKLTVRQNRGLRNCARTDEVQQFENEWLKYIKKVSEEEKNHGKQRNKHKSAA